MSANQLSGGAEATRLEEAYNKAVRLLPKAYALTPDEIANLTNFLVSGVIVPKLYKANEPWKGILPYFIDSLYKVYGKEEGGWKTPSSCYYLKLLYKWYIEDRSSVSDPDPYENKHLTPHAAILNNNMKILYDIYINHVKPTKTRMFRTKGAIDITQIEQHEYDYLCAVSDYINELAYQYDNPTTSVTKLSNILKGYDQLQEDINVLKAVENVSENSDLEELYDYINGALLNYLRGCYIGIVLSGYKPEFPDNIEHYFQGITGLMSAVDDSEEYHPVDASIVMDVVPLGDRFSPKIQNDDERIIREAVVLAYVTSIKYGKAQSYQVAYQLSAANVGFDMEEPDYAWDHVRNINSLLSGLKRDFERFRVEFDAGDITQETIENDVNPLWRTYRNICTLFPKETRSLPELDFHVDIEEDDDVTRIDELSKETKQNLKLTPKGEKQTPITPRRLKKEIKYEAKPLTFTPKAEAKIEGELAGSSPETFTSPKTEPKKTTDERPVFPYVKQESDEDDDDDTKELNKATQNILATLSKPNATPNPTLYTGEWPPPASSIPKLDTLYMPKIPPGGIKINIPSMLKNSSTPTPRKYSSCF